MQQCEYSISAENRLSVCDEVAELVSAFCGQYLKKKRDVLRYRLTVEECLLGWLTEESVGHTLTVATAKARFHAPTITLTFDGMQCNPYETEDKRIGGDAGFSALRILGLAPTYSYDNGINTLRFDVTANSNSEFRRFFIVLALAIAVGYLGPVLCAHSTLNVISNIFLLPVYNLLLNILNLIAGPLIFMSVAWGIFNIGDAMSFNKIGKTVILSYIKTDFLVCFLGLAAIPLFGLNFNAGQLGETYFSSFVNMVLDSVPANIVDPFSAGNTIQIILLAVVFGATVLFLGKKVSSLARAIEQANLLLQHILAAVSKLIPLLIFVVIVNLFWTDSFQIMQSSWKFFAILLGGTIVLCLGYLLLTSIRYRLNVFSLIRKISPSVAVAFLTACTTATLETTMNICTEKLGIKKSLTSFGVPLGMVVQNPVNCFNYFIITLFFASVYGVECSAIWYLTALVCCTVLAVATPPIPGGGVVVFSMLFLQLGIPTKAVAIVTAINMLADFLTTGGDVLFLFPSLIRIADKSGLLDIEQLRK